jgi:hypothetical protein
MERNYVEEQIKSKEWMWLTFFFFFNAEEPAGDET